MSMRRRRPPPILWSKGISQSCDFGGPARYWLQDTESRRSEEFFRRHYAGAHGLVWVRLGTRARKGRPCDLDGFVRGALPTVRAPFALLTTDGDAAVPGDLAPTTVAALLDCPWLVSWHTQNHDGTRHVKLAPIPIGLDLHTPRPEGGPRRLVSLLGSIRDGRGPVDETHLRVFSDLGVNLNSEGRREAVAALRDCDHVDLLETRIAQHAIWERYAAYPFVLSARGNGLDCHRTWEALCLGAIVITRTSPLNPLFDGLPVVVVEDWRQVRDRANLAKWLKQYGPLTDRERVWNRLAPDTILRPIRKRLEAVEREHA
jgi:hypothetical protein